MRPPLNRIPIVMRIGRLATLDRDAAARRPLPPSDTAGTEITLRVQWIEEDRNREFSRPGGDEPDASGYFLIRPRDLAAAEAAAGAVLAKGDVIITKDSTPVRPRVYVIATRRIAHQSAGRGGTVVRVDFSDRSPT